MSACKGNTNRTRPQKHQNKTAFKNDLHDTSKRTKILNSLEVSGVCSRCKDIIEWKIKYKKYKPLSAPSKCVLCNQKTVKHAYHVLCTKCATEKAVCAKCNKPIDTKEVAEAEKICENENQIEAQLKGLPERKRRTILRYIKKLKINEQNIPISDLEKLTMELDKCSFSDGIEDLSDETEGSDENEKQNGFVK